MKRFWDAIIEPILEAARPKSILEVGSDHGENTRNLLAFCEAHDAVLHVVDPVPKYDVAEWQERHGERFVFHQELSLDALSRIDAPDLALLDGDHNWYTVYNELRMIEERCVELSKPFPLVILHDVGWPFGRRDLYYDPDTIPKDYRKPHGPGGIRPGVEGLLEEGGMIRGLEKATSEGGPHNGVFTAVEDFLEETEQELELIVIPGFHGLALLIPSGARRNEGLAEILNVWDLPPDIARHTERLEEAWLEVEVRRQGLHVRNQRLAEGIRTMETLRARLEERDEEITRLWAELAERTGEASREQETT